MARTFHYSKWSLYPYTSSSNLTILIGLTLITIALCWVAYPWNWIDGLILFLWLISSSFYLHWKGQNYNILGWIFFPIILSMLPAENHLMLGIFYFLVSLFSFTGWFVLSIIFGIYVLVYNDWQLLLSCIPGTLFILTLFIPLIFSNSGGTIIVNIAKAIGIDKKKAKYVRKFERKREWVLTRIYEFSLYVLFGLTFFGTMDYLPVYYVILVFFYIMNYFGLRFMDVQSVNILFCMAIIVLMLDSQHWVTIGVGWLAINPLPIALNIKTKDYITLSPVRPFKVSEIYLDLESFLESVKSEQKVLMIYKDPGNDYDKLFDGLRPFIEIPHYIANKKNIHLLPDWWSIFEVNYEGAPDFWAASPEQAKFKMKEWGADFIIVYQKDNSILKDEWIQAGFEVMAFFDWSKYEELKSDLRLQRIGFPQWWLLKLDV